MPAENARKARWAPVRAELERWAATGRPARLWLRDDDAVAPTPLLMRLLDLCSLYRVSPMIAVIPSNASEDLAAAITHAPLAEIAVHGWSHRNHAAAGHKAEEFPLHRSREVVLHELMLARERLDVLFGERATGLYVPPWNRIAPEVAGLLPRAGFPAVSTFGRGSLFSGPAPLKELNTHVDIIDWRGTRGGRDPDWLVNALAEELAWARGQENVAVGILTHHLVHDDLAWQFLEELMAETAVHPAVRWTRASELI